MKYITSVLKSCHLAVICVDLYTSFVQSSFIKVYARLLANGGLSMGPVKSLYRVVMKAC